MRIKGWKKTKETNVQEIWSSGDFWLSLEITPIGWTLELFSTTKGNVSTDFTKSMERSGKRTYLGGYRKRVEAYNSAMKFMRGFRAD